MTDTLYPAAFKQRMKLLLGNEYDAFIESLNQTAPTSIRLNPAKPIAKFMNDEPVPWCTTGRYLKERPSFTFDPLFHAGTYYVQEAGSMFIEQAWKQITTETGSRALRVLDMCAAPGGKSTHLLALMNNNGLLVSNEIIPNRNKILQENISKWGYANAVVTQNQAADFIKLKDFFDVALIDAPCSGEGLFRKDRDAIAEWSEKNVDLCSVRQKDIIKAAVECVKPGGYLIYSTCTYEPAENDENIAWLQQWDMEPVALQVKNKNIQPTKYGYSFLPHRVKSEGFYLCLCRKKSNDEAGGRTNTSPKLPPQKKMTKLASAYLQHAENFILQEHRGYVVAIAAHCYYDIQLVTGHLHAKQYGITLGQPKGNDFIPAHQLAISTVVAENLPHIDLDYEQAITYLRCEPLKLNTALRGWCLVKHEGYNLGWIKVMDNRSNNYYPRDWRILKQGPI